MNERSLLIRRQEATGDEFELELTPARAGFAYCGLRVIRLAPGERRPLFTAGEEIAVLPLAGSATVELDGCRFELAGRESVFSRVSDWAYVPVETDVVLTSER